MTILVTGTAGFIGFHLAEKLLILGHKVVGLDNINNYYDTELKYGRLEASGIQKNKISYNNPVDSTKYKAYRFYNITLEDHIALNYLFDVEKPEIVINLAAQAGVRYSLENPMAYIKGNIEGFLNVLEACRNFKIKHLIYASSSSVYGLNNDLVFSTSNNVDHPVSLYAATKRSNELMAHVYSHLYNLPTTGVRFFTVYGPWGRPDMAPIIFTKAILEGKPISIYNNGNMMRDFTFVDDIVEGLSLLINHTPVSRAEEYKNNPSPSISPAPFAIYNIGNNSPVKLMDFIEVLEAKLKVKAIKVFKPMQPGDVLSTYADITTLIQNIGYRPTTNLNDGIDKFVKWYRNYFNIIG